MSGPDWTDRDDELAHKLTAPTTGPTMLEKIARAMFDRWNKGLGLSSADEGGIWLAFRDDYVNMASAALEAMREPSTNMSLAGFKATTGHVLSCKTGEQSWTAMIDAILSGDA